MELKINNRKYRLNIFWHTVTLRQAIDICNIDYDVEKIINDDGSNMFSDNDYEYIKKVVTILSNIPTNVIDKLDNTQLVVLWDLVSYMVKSLYLVKFDNYRPRGMKSIIFKDKTYHLPDSLIIDEEEIIAHKEPAVNIVEVSNLAMYLSEMKSKGLSSMKYICAILLKEDKDEVYDEEKIVERAKLFEELTMNIVFECFFFINYFSNNYLLSSVNCSVENQTKKQNIILGFIQSLRKKLRVILRKFKN